MAQKMSRGGPTPATAEVVAVADLRGRNAPAPVPIPAQRTGSSVSVDSLLRREAGAPNAVDRPGPPRGHRRRPAIARDSTRVLVRRGAVAAGTLLVAGSAVGAAVLADAAGGGDQAVPHRYPGQGRLDAVDPPVALPATVDPTAATGPLEVGATPLTSWVAVAFPDTAAGAPDARAVPARPGGVVPVQPAGAIPARPAASPPGGSNLDTGTPDATAPPTPGTPVGPSAVDPPTADGSPPGTGAPSNLAPAGGTGEAVSDADESHSAPEEPALSTIDREPTGLLGGVGRIAADLLG